jgi:hypothetical protein
MNRSRPGFLALALAGACLLPAAALAHCDTMDGPVVADARRALGAGDVAPVLKWIGPGDEPEIREAFAHALAVRALGEEARGLADRFFFETLVRVHRAGEGAPFTGLRPAGAPVEPIVAAADRALSAGSDGELVEHLTHVVTENAQRRFAAASRARAHAEHDAEAGRRYVAAYVELTHWLERLEQAATTDAAHAAGREAAPAAAHAHGAAGR